MGSISDHAKKGDVPAKRTYRVSEIADILGVSNATAYRLIKEGHFRTVSIGSSIRVSKQWLTFYENGESHRESFGKC